MRSSPTTRISSTTTCWPCSRTPRGWPGPGASSPPGHEFPRRCSAAADGEATPRLRVFAPSNLIENLLPPLGVFFLGDGPVSIELLELGETLLDRPLRVRGRRARASRLQVV